MSLELLEERLTPAFSILDTTTAVTFTADSANNTLAVRVTGQTIEYNANGAGFVALANARANTVASFVVQGGNGNDVIDMSPCGSALTGLGSLGKGVDLRGGDGNDTLIGTELNDLLDGGAGTDALVGGKGDDLLKALDEQTDTLDGGLGRDSVYFDSTDNGPVSCEVWNPFTPALDNQKQKVKVLVLNYDPLIPSQGNQHLYDLFGSWTNPVALAAEYKDSLERTSGGAIDFEITEWRNLNEIPALEDGFRYTPDQYYQNRLTNSGWHDQAVKCDYPRLLAEQNVPAMIDAGQIDEVWWFGDHFFGLWESMMAGPGAFFINGGTYPQVASQRAFAIMGFSYERGVAEMLHNNGHRVESTMNRI